MDRVALITGCSSGIGRACAEQFARAGYAVYATARDPQRLAELERFGCVLRALDVTDARAIDAIVAEIEAERGAVDVLIDNAGYGQQGAFEETSLDQFRAQLETNVIGAIAVVQRVLPRMRERASGRILLMSSMGGRITFPGGAAYHASKFALEAVGDVLRFEVARFGIDVVIVEPGLVDTGYGATSLAGLAGRDAGPYAKFTAGLRAALERSFSGAVPGTSSADDVARACLSAALAMPAPTRVVVGAMAETLIRQRASLGDGGWDDFVEAMYPRPKRESE